MNKKLLGSLLLISSLTAINLFASGKVYPCLYDGSFLPAPGPALGHYDEKSYDLYTRCIALLNNSDIPPEIKHLIPDSIPNGNIVYSLMVAKVKQGIPINTIFHGFLQKITKSLNCNQKVNMGLFHPAGIKGIDMPIDKLCPMDVNFHDGFFISPNNAKFEMTANVADFWAIAVYANNAMVCHVRLMEKCHPGNLIDIVQAMHDSSLRPKSKLLKECMARYEEMKKKTPTQGSDDYIMELKYNVYFYLQKLDNPDLSENDVEFYEENAREHLTMLQYYEVIQ